MSFARRLVVIVVLSLLLFAGLPGMEMMRTDALAAGLPTIAGLSTHNGDTTGGTSVIITGANFTGATAVTLGGTAATTFTVDSDTQITATTAAHDNGSGRVIVTTAGGSNADTIADDWAYTTRYEASTILGSGFIYSPRGWSSWAASDASGGNYMLSQTSGSYVTVTFTGTYLALIAKTSTAYGAASVQVDGGTAQTVDLYRTSTYWQQNVWNTGTLTSGTHTVKIDWAASSGQSIDIDAVEITGFMGGGPVPTITSLSPTSGPTDGGTGVIITGTNLTNAASVTFGALAATRYSVNSATQITAVAPVQSAAIVDVRVIAASGTSAIVAADHFTYVAPPATTRSEQTSGALVWAPSYTSWTTVSSTSYSGGTLKYTNTPGGSVTIPFSGTYLALICKTSPSYGMAKVTVDGTSVTNVNLYSTATLYKQNVFNTGILPSGLHVVKLEWTGTPGATGGGTNVTVDGVDVAGSLTAATRFEQIDGHLVWAPSYSAWTTGSLTSYSGGSLKYINSTGSVTVNFTGVRLTLIVKRSTAYGYAKVTLDGTTVYNVNLYNASTLYKNAVWSTPFLTPGNHTVKIEWTGTKGSSSVSGSTNINLDAVDVIGALH
jgi:hypothetical protein